MDKRIIKTKNNIKQTLIKMLGEKRFEEITIKELCEVAQTSRITFYTHYSDKSELANDIFEDMHKIAVEEYHRLQSENNPLGDIVGDYINVLDCILNVYYKNYDFFCHTKENVSPTLNYMYFKIIDDSIRAKAEKDKDRLNPRFPLSMTCDFICSGIKGFISAGRRNNMTYEEIHPMARELLKSLLENEIVRK